jgi:hypothetical protein
MHRRLSVIHRPGRIEVGLLISAHSPSPRREEPFSYQHLEHRLGNSSLFQAIGDMNVTETDNGQHTSLHTGQR